MSYSLINADPGTHCKIVALAVAGGVTFALLAGGAWRTEPNSPAARSGTALRAFSATVTPADAQAKMRQDVVSRTPGPAATKIAEAS